MGSKTGISWTDSTWNPLRGCSKVSAGCANCYAESVASRFSGEGMPYHGLARDGHWTGEVHLVPEKLDQPLRWRRPRRIFVNSMSDLFHERVDDETIDRIFSVMATTHQHTFQVLTKRPERMRAYFANASPGRSLVRGLRNVWLGVSVEDQATADARIPVLLSTPAAVWFVSAEPLLGPVQFGVGGEFFDYGRGRDARNEPRLSLVIVGGESGPRARPCDVAWIRSTVKQCREAGVACFVKQLGARPLWEDRDFFGTPSEKQKLPRQLWRVPCLNRAGADPAEWPEDLRVQQFPEANHA